MRTYEIFKNGKIQLIDAKTFVDVAAFYKKAICLRMFEQGEVQWISPDFEKYTTVATRLGRNQKLELLGI